MNGKEKTWKVLVVLFNGDVCAVSDQKLSLFQNFNSSAALHAICFLLLTNSQCLLLSPMTVVVP